MTAVVSASSLEYVRVPVAATVAGAPVNPTADVVKLAFITPGATPAAGDLKTASWDTDTTTTPTTYRAQCLVGPGGTITLTAGLYVVWVQVVDNPEIVLRPAGILEVI
jgi:hypothetical protein